MYQEPQEKWFWVSVVALTIPGLVMLCVFVYLLATPSPPDDPAKMEELGVAERAPAQDAGVEAPLDADPAPEPDSGVERISVRQMLHPTLPVEPEPVYDAVDALVRIAISEANFEVSRDEIHALAAVGYNIRGDCVATGPQGRSPGVTQCRMPDGTLVDVRPGQSLPEARESLLSALRRASPYATGARRPRRLDFRQRWVVTLDGTKPPTGWVECDDSHNRCHGRWASYSDEVERITEEATRAVRRPLSRCRARVLTWGGDMDITSSEDEPPSVLERRNMSRMARGQPPLVEINCGQTANHFYAALPERIWLSRAEDDRCGPRPVSPTRLGRD